MSEWQQFLTVGRVHLRTLRTRLWLSFSRSKLVGGTLSLFLVLYCVGTYTIFSKGLNYLAQVPAAGHILADRVLYLIFFSFFLMLTFSTAVTGFIGIYRGRETSWLMTLPVSHRVIFLLKALEAALFSGWGLIFIIGPLLLAFAQYRDAPPSFYLKALGAGIPFVLTSASLAACALLLIARWVNRRVLIALLVLAGVATIGWGSFTYFQEKERVEQAGFSAAVAFQGILRHTDAAEHNFWPSSWLTRSIVQWSRGYASSTALMYPLLLISNGLLGAMVAAALARHWYYDSWNGHIQHGALAAMRTESRYRRRQEKRRARGKRDDADPLTSFFQCVLSRPLAAVSSKDVRSFFRDSSQWAQFLVVFGLLSLYALTLRHMDYDAQSPRETTLISYLNLAVCALALSTLSTRFVFPQFSLEGRRIWILAMSPVHLPHVVWQKFVFASLFTGILAGLILLLSGKMLELPMNDLSYFCFAIVLLSTGLNGLAVGFGALFPNFDERNAARIVSGFGGTLCLICSFLFIASFLGAMVVSRWSVFRDNNPVSGWLGEGQSGLIGFGAAMALSILFTGLPLALAMRRLKKLEIMGEM